MNEVTEILNNIKDGDRPRPALLFATGRSRQSYLHRALRHPIGCVDIVDTQPTADRATPGRRLGVFLEHPPVVFHNEILEPVFGDVTWVTAFYDLPPRSVDGDDDAYV